MRKHKFSGKERKSTYDFYGGMTFWGQSIHVCVVSTQHFTVSRVPRVDNVLKMLSPKVGR